MNRNQLRYFVAAAEHRSFTKAAEQYYISQTAVTQQIQQLEQSLGCELFDRSTRPVSLTSAGSAFLQDAKAILERMSRAQERVHDAATGLTGTLRVGYVRADAPFSPEEQQCADLFLSLLDGRAGRGAAASGV